MKKNKKIHKKNIKKAKKKYPGLIVFFKPGDIVRNSTEFFIIDFFYKYHPNKGVEYSVHSISNVLHTTLCQHDLVRNIAYNRR